MSASTACQLLNVNTNTSRSQLKYPPRRGGASQGQHVVIYWLFLENNSDSQALLHWSLLSLPFLLALDAFEVSNWKASVGWDLKKHQVFGQQKAWRDVLGSSRGATQIFGVVSAGCSALGHKTRRTKADGGHTPGNVMIPVQSFHRPRPSS